MGDSWLGLGGKVCVVTGGAGGLGRAIGAALVASTLLAIVVSALSMRWLAPGAPKP